MTKNVYSLLFKMQSQSDKTSQLIQFLIVHNNVLNIISHNHHKLHTDLIIKFFFISVQQHFHDY